MKLFTSEARVNLAVGQACVYESQIHSSKWCGKMLRRGLVAAVLGSVSSAAAWGQQSLPTAACATGMQDQTLCFQAAIKLHPGQMIAVNPGTYTLSGPLILGMNQGLVGAGRAATTLQFTTPSAALVFASSTNVFAGGGGLQHITINSIGNTASSIGLYLGGDPANVHSHSNWWANTMRFDDITVAGFGTGIQFGQNVYGDSFTNSIFMNLVDMHAPANIGGGEKMVISNCLFGEMGSGIVDNDGMEWMIDNSAFDQLPGPAITITGPAGVNWAGHLSINRCHFETPVLSANGFIYSPSGTPVINIQDTTFLAGTNAGAAMINTSLETAQVNMIGGYVDSLQSIALVNTGANVLLQSVSGNTHNLVRPFVTNPPAHKVSNLFGGPF